MRPSAPAWYELIEKDVAMGEHPVHAFSHVAAGIGLGCSCIV